MLNMQTQKNEAVEPRDFVSSKDLTEVDSLKLENASLCLESQN